METYYENVCNDQMNMTQGNGKNIVLQPTSLLTTECGRRFRQNCQWGKVRCSLFLPAAIIKCPLGFLSFQQLSKLFNNWVFGISKREVEGRGRVSRS